MDILQINAMIKHCRHLIASCDVPMSHYLSRVFKRDLQSPWYHQSFALYVLTFSVMSMQLTIVFTQSVKGGFFKIGKCPFWIISHIFNLLVIHCGVLNQPIIDKCLENTSNAIEMKIYI